MVPSPLLLHVPFSPSSIISKVKKSSSISLEYLFKLNKVKRKCRTSKNHNYKRNELALAMQGSDVDVQ